MDWVFEVKVKDLLSPSQQPFFLPQTTSPPSVQSGGFDQDNKISPSILLIIIILAIIFFISGLLHLLVRFLLRPPSRDPVDSEHATILQGQLQQLFHLHDAGVDQSFIDTLPVFVYKAIIGVKNPFDCAVCLCEFEAEDKLRLLPKCSHAFHMECIDTWLLSHSTCPLCRGSLLPDLSSSHCCSPIVFVLESGSESSREIVSDREAAAQGSNRGSFTGAHLGSHGEDDGGFSQKSCEIPVKKDPPPAPPEVSEERVVPVKLGKFTNVDGGGGGGEGSSSNSNVDSRRCFSMGSFEYVMDERSLLQVPIRPPTKNHTTKKPSLPLMPGHRAAMSECGGHSCREGFKGFDAVKGSTSSSNFHGESSIGMGTGAAVETNKRESFSISKIWLRSKKEKPSAMTTGDPSSRRAFSFRFPVNHRISSEEDLKAKQNNNSSRRTISEIDVARWESGAGSELGFDEEVGSCISLDSQAKTPSFARRTLLWLVGRQNKVVHSSSSLNNV